MPATTAKVALALALWYWNFLLRSYPCIHPVRVIFDVVMASSDLSATIRLLDPTGQTRCHCGSKAKWIASLGLEGAQISPAFQHEDLCNDHAEQFAAKHNLGFPRSEGSSALKQRPKKL